MLLKSYYIVDLSRLRGRLVNVELKNGQMINEKVFAYGKPSIMSSGVHRYLRSPSAKLLRNEIQEK